jgi:hypothetical protein
VLNLQKDVELLKSGSQGAAVDELSPQKSSKWLRTKVWSQPVRSEYEEAEAFDCFSTEYEYEEDTYLP